MILFVEKNNIADVIESNELVCLMHRSLSSGEGVGG